jgi:hypothetical protein
MWEERNNGINVNDSTFYKISLPLPTKLGSNYCGAQVRWKRLSEVASFNQPERDNILPRGDSYVLLTIERVSHR